MIFMNFPTSPILGLQQAARMGRSGTVELLLETNGEKQVVDARCGRREQ